MAGAAGSSSLKGKALWRPLEPYLSPRHVGGDRCRRSRPRRGRIDVRPARGRDATGTPDRDVRHGAAPLCVQFGLLLQGRTAHRARGKGELRTSQQGIEDCRKLVILAHVVEVLPFPAAFFKSPRSRSCTRGDPSSPAGRPRALASAPRRRPGHRQAGRPSRLRRGGTALSFMMSRPGHSGKGRDAHRCTGAITRTAISGPGTFGPGCLSRRASRPVAPTRFLRLGSIQGQDFSGDGLPIPRAEVAPEEEEPF